MVLKRLFGKKKKQELPPIAVDDWIDEFEKEYKKHMKDLLDDLSENINKEAERLRFKAQNFQEITPSGPEISPRIEGIIKQNQTKYVRKLRVLAIDALLDKTVTAKKTREAYEHFSAALQEFHETTNRNYYRLKDYFYADLREIIRIMKSLEKLYTELEQIVETEKQEKFTILKEKVKQLKKDKITNGRLNEDVEYAKKDIEDFKQKIEELEKEKQSLKLTPDYNQNKETYEKKEKISQKLWDKKNELLYIFKEIKDPLAKFSKIDAHERLIEKYLDDPISAALSDVTYGFDKVSLKLDNALKEGKVKIQKGDGANIKKAMQKLLKNNYIKMWSHEYNTLKNTVTEIDKILNKNSTMIDISEFDYNLGHQNDKLRKAENIILDCEEKIKDINVEERRLDLEHELYEFADRKVKIID